MCSSSFMKQNFVVLQISIEQHCLIGLKKFLIIQLSLLGWTNSVMLITTISTRFHILYTFVALLLLEWFSKLFSTFFSYSRILVHIFQKSIILSAISGSIVCYTIKIPLPLITDHTNKHVNLYPVELFSLRSTFLAFYYWHSSRIF